MATITWQTTSGSLGNYPAGTTLSIQFNATSDDITSAVRYKLLSGNLPVGIKSDPFVISIPGILTGTIETVYTQTTYTFTVRAYDQYGTVRDRTFNITATINVLPQFTNLPGKLISTQDSTWVDYTIGYNNPVPKNVVTISLTSGSLPPGLYLTSDGKIQGYAKPPFLTSGSPIVKSYLFTLALTSELGNTSVQYSIEVINQEIFKPPHNRAPTIYNSKWLSNDITDNQDFGFFIQSDNRIPAIKSNEYFTFKVLGIDFDGDMLEYSFGNLPLGLVGDPVTGWITGTPVMNNTGVNDYNFSVTTYKKYKPTLMSASETFTLRVVNALQEDIVWETPSDLGIIYNNTVSTLFVKANSSKTLIYTLLSGTLPANLTLEDSGALSGKVAFQPSDILLTKNEESEYEFTVQVFAAEYPSLRGTKTFKLIVKQYYMQPVETVYFKISPSVSGRQMLSSLLTDTSLIPDADLYRIDDPYFGKSEFIKIVQAYGIQASTLQTYLDAIQTNHYYRDISLGNLKTAVARDENGDILYEVVYSEIIDPMTTSTGNNLPEKYKWPRPIKLNLGPWTVNNSDLHASFTGYHTNLSPGVVQTLYPASIDNMRNRLVSSISQNTDASLLPKWMTSQQENGNTLGFVKCWVICYTKPGKSSTIKTNIENNWSGSLVGIDCTIDRYYVDKSSTYNWDLELSIPAWTELPSEVHTNNLDQHDQVVLFSNKTILPR